MSSTRTATALLSQLDAEIDRNKKFLRGLQDARKCIASTVLDGVSTPRHRRQRKTSANGKSRVDLIKAILREANEPLSVKGIADEMRQRGRADENRNIPSTLSYLKRASVVKKPDRGLWTSATEEVAQAA